MNEEFPDQQESSEIKTNPSEVKASKLPATPEKQAAQHRQKSKESIDAILNKIEHETTSSESYKDRLETDQPKPSDMPVHRGLKIHALKSTLKRTRKKLPAYQRPFSKLVHAPLIDTISETAAATVARPSGLLVGGIFSVLGSLAVLIICRFYGYEYNFMIGLACFVVGFFAGLIVELLFKSFSKSR